MKVLHVSGARSWGGNEQQLMYLIDELDKLGVEQVLFCYKETPLEKTSALHPVKIRSIERAKPHTSTYRKEFRKIIAEENIELMHLHTSDSVTGFVVTDILKPLGVPTVFAKKGVRERNSFLSKFKYNYRNIDRIIVISEYVKENFKSVLKPVNHKKLVTVYNGIKLSEQEDRADFNIREKLGLEKEIILFGSIANHTRAKDLMTLIEAVKELLKNGEHNFHVVQMGTPSKLTPEFEKAVEDLNIGSHFTFLGFVANAVAYMPQLDALIISSKREGGPSSLMEAFSRKTAVISTKVGVVEEVIENGKNGFFVPTEDPEALAHKMAALVQIPQKAKEFGDRSFEKFKQGFTAEHLGKSTFNVYRELLESKGNIVHK